MTRVAIGFDLETRSLALSQILATKALPIHLMTSTKYAQTRNSIAGMGLLEPLVVTLAEAGPGQHLLLEGHVRLVALKELGRTEAPCLFASDDEAFTYNNRVNRLATIQEHIMIRRAVEHGVSQELIAKRLSVDILQITKKLHLLEGICPEAIDLLKDREFSVELGRIIRKMKPMRQVECAELMLSANNLTLTYARALLAGSPASALVGKKPERKLAGASPEQMAKMEREMTNVQGEYRLAEQTYAQDVLNFVMTQKYLARLLENDKVARFLRTRQPDVLEQLATIVKCANLES